MNRDTIVTIGAVSLGVVLLVSVVGYYLLRWPFYFEEDVTLDTRYWGGYEYQKIDRKIN